MITGPADGSYLDTDMPVISGTGEPGATVTVFDGDGNVILVADVDEDGNWSGTPDEPLEDREYTFVATQTDPAGNTSDESNAVTVVVDTTAPDAPVITGPTSGTITNDPSPTISGTGEPGATITVTDGDGNVILTTTVDEDGNWSGTPDEPLVEGTHTLTATQTDKAGNTSAPSNEVDLEVDVTVPDPLTVTGPKDGAEILTDRITFTGTGEPGATVTIRDEKGTVVCTTTVAEDGSWSCLPSATFPDGKHTFSIVQTDAAGNVSAESVVSVSIDTRASLKLVLWGTYEDANDDGDADRGEVITWHTRLVNTGRLTLTDLEIEDTRRSDQVCRIDTLAAGESVECIGTTTHTITKKDERRGFVPDKAVATARVADLPGAQPSSLRALAAHPGDLVISNEDTARIKVTVHPAAAAAPDDGTLANSGSEFSWGLGVAGVGAVGLGAWLLAASRRRREEAEVEA